MAFPVVQTADTKSGTVTSNSSTWTLTWPTNIQAGDLVLAFLASDGTGQFSFSGVWGQVAASSVANSLSMGWHVCDGTETGTFTATGPGVEQGGWRVFRITNWYGGGISTGVKSWNADLNYVNFAVAASTTGVSANPDSGNLDPTNWATEDTLWMSFCSLDTSRTISSYPLATNQSADVSGGSTGASLGICMSNSTVASLNPGTWTISASDDWVAGTLAVRQFIPPTPVFDGKFFPLL